MAALPTLTCLRFDGRAALDTVLARSSYRSAAQAIASLTAFTHPGTIAQIPGGALFPCVRSIGRHDRRTLDVTRRVGFDDNAVAQATFAWCNGRARPGRDIQLNHIHARRDDPLSFTAPANLCASPAFLAKLTDHDPHISDLLKRRAYALYGWAPAGLVPHKPASYDDVVWADPMPFVPNLEEVLRARMARCSKHFAVRIARELGWAFSGGEPDHSLRVARLTKR